MTHHILTTNLASTTIVPEHFMNKLAVCANSLSIRDISQLRQAFNIWLKESFNRYDMDDLLTARASFVDALLAKLWCQHHLDEEQVSLIAVGGYGRG